MMLWIVFGAMAALAVAIVLRPLMAARDPAPARAAHERAVYRDQLGELDRDVARGLINEDEADSARAEIARRLLATTHADQTATSAQTHQWRRIAAVFVIVAVPAIALGAYLPSGAPDLPLQPFAARQAAPAENQDLPTLVARIERHLQENPTDASGWDVIGPAYMRLQRYSDAVDAFTRAIALGGETAPRLVSLGEARVFLASGMVDAGARSAFERAAALNAGLAQPRYYLGLAAVQDGDVPRAAGIWQELIASAPPGAPWVEEVSRQLAAARQHADVVGDARRQNAPGPGAEDIAAAAALSAEERGAMIESMVAGLAARLEDQPDDLDGWLRLTRAYVVLGRRDEAIEALAKARGNFAGQDDALGQLDDAADALGLNS